MAINAFAASFLILLMASPTVFGTDYTVGGSSGWALGVDYSTWASGKTFKVGDTLLFNYDSTHQVDIVDANAYQSCSSSNPTKNFKDGKTKISLDKTGKMYFLCPQPGHCAGGMKLAVNVVAASGGSPPPKASPTTPSGSPPKSSPTTPSTPSGTPPPTTTPSGSPSTPTPSTPSAPSPSGAISVVAPGGMMLVSAVVLGFMMF